MFPSFPPITTMTAELKCNYILLKFFIVDEVLLLWIVIRIIPINEVFFRVIIHTLSIESVDFLYNIIVDAL